MKTIAFFIILLNISIGQANEAFSITCPKIAEYYSLNADKTMTGIKDLISSLKETRGTSEELIINIIDLSNSKYPNVAEFNKILEIKKTLLMKEARAKENYNDQLSILANYSAKVKSCWGYLSKDEKDQVSSYLNKFQKYKILDNFKLCYKYMNTTNIYQSKKYNLSQQYYRKEINSAKFKEQYTLQNVSYKKAEKEEIPMCAYLFNPKDKDKPLSKGEQRLLGF